uniref:Putative coat protein n=1 Tax=Lichen partiti-like RNA virus sp. TaxID=2726938 RepID=A0A6J4CUB7_9VIRU|nr:putative coat protein [Lichen partiti-like RNA virus sp.]
MSNQHTRFTSQAETNLDHELAKDAGTDSLEPVQPSRDIDLESGKPRVHQTVSPQTTKSKAPELSKETVSSTLSTEEADASAMLETVMRTWIVRPPRYKISTYTPCSTRMFYILNCMNTVLMNNFYARRSMPALHPLPVRIYFSILWIIQTLRCMKFVNRIDQDQSDFIVRFLSAYPPEDLHIPGPLLAVYKSLSTSQPEDKSFGKVSPHVSDLLGPSEKSDLIRDSETALLIPQVPILMAMNHILANLPNNVTSESQWSPIKPGTGNLPAAVTFMGSTFVPNRTTWTPRQSWALSSPGIEYPIEANAQLMDSYRQNAFILDIPDAPDDIALTSDFLNLSDLEWFGRLNEMMAIYARYFHGSGTLADCALSGVSANQVYGQYKDQSTAPSRPTGFGDRTSRVKLVCTHKTTTRELPQLFELMAFNSQTNMRLPSNHPFKPNAGAPAYGVKEGPFWDIRPESSDSSLDESYLGIMAKVSQMHVQKGLL